MVQRLLLEVCAFNIESCIIAENLGAGRIELCADYSAGGTTPSHELIERVKEKLSIPIYPIIRPRGGDFLYSAEEFSAMQESILLCKDLHCEGIVTGIHLQNGEIDVVRFKQLIGLAHPMGVTCHRVFDRTPDPFKALTDIIACGCERVLTSGQANKAIDATTLLAELIAKAGNKITIMPGGGIRSSNIEQLIKETGAIEFHTSALTDKTENIDKNELAQILAILNKN